MRIDPSSPAALSLTQGPLGSLALATAGVQRPRTAARLKPSSARISASARARGTGGGPRFPIEPVIAWLLAATAVILSGLIANS